jgi:hypothetical protein
MIEVLKEALEALKDVGVLTDREWQAVHKNKANELRQAIKELEGQEPVGQLIVKEYENVSIVDIETDLEATDNLPAGQYSVYIYPPQRTEQEPVTSSLVECVMSARKEFSAIKGESQFCTECHAFERADSWWQEWHGGDIDYITGAVYTHPPQRKPLMASEIVLMYDENPRCDADMIDFAREIEAAHGIKE